MRIIKYSGSNKVEIRAESSPGIIYPFPKDLKKIIDFIGKIQLSEFHVDSLELSINPLRIIISGTFRTIIFSKLDTSLSLNNSIKEIIMWLLNNFNTSHIRKLEITETADSVLITSGSFTYTLVTSIAFHKLMNKLCIYKDLILYNLNDEEMNIVKNQFDKYTKIICELKYPIVVHKVDQENITITKYAKQRKTIKNIHELDLIPFIIETNILDDELERSICQFIKMQLL